MDPVEVAMLAQLARLALEVYKALQRDTGSGERHKALQALQQKVSNLEKIVESSIERRKPVQQCIVQELEQLESFAESLMTRADQQDTTIQDLDRRLRKVEDNIPEIRGAAGSSTPTHDPRASRAGGTPAKQSVSEAKSGPQTCYDSLGGYPALRVRPNDEEIELHSIIWGESEARLLAGALPLFRNLRSLCLNRLHIGGGGVVAITTHFVDSPRARRLLQILGFTDVSAGDEGAHALAELFGAGVPALKSLRFSHNIVSRDGGLAMARAARDGAPNLEYLFMSMCGRDRDALRDEWRRLGNKGELNLSI